MNAPATNFPPDSNPLRDRLLETYAEILARADQLIAAASRVPEQLDEESLHKATDFVARQLKPCREAIEAARVGEKAPFLEAGRTVDALFATALGSLALAIARVEGTIGRYLSDKLADLEPGSEIAVADAARTKSAIGSLATLRTDVGFEVTDTRSAITHVWRHIDGAAVEKAIRRYARERGPEFKAEIAQAGSVHESGIRFFIQRKALTR